MTDDRQQSTSPDDDARPEPPGDGEHNRPDDSVFFDFESNSDSEDFEYDYDPNHSYEHEVVESTGSDAAEPSDDGEPGPLIVDDVAPVPESEPESEPKPELEPEPEPEAEPEPDREADAPQPPPAVAASAVPRVRQRVDVRALAILLGRLSAGVITAWLAIAAIGGATIAEIPTLTVTPPSAVVAPVPAPQQLVCAGAFLRLADDSGQGASSTSPISRPSTRYLSTVGNASVVPIPESESGTGGSDDAPLVLSTVAGESAARTLLAGAQSQYVERGEASGFDAVECSAASVVTWLVGGASDLGRTTVISLTNPTEVAATVDLKIYGENGVEPAPGTTGIIVPPGSQRLLPLAAFVPDVRSPAIHVTSTGGQVVATMQQTTVRTLDPGGVASITGAASPSTTTVISGMRLVGVERVQSLLGVVGYDDLTSMLRILVPGDTPTTATINIVPETADGTGTSFSLQLDATRVTDLPLDEIEDGIYTVVIETDAPVTAGLRVATVGTSSNDFTWLAADRRLVDQALVTVAPGPDPRLHIYNSTTETSTISVEQVGAGVAEMDIPAGTAVSMPVAAGGSYLLSGFDRAVASISYAGDGQLGSYPVLPASDAPPPVVVFLR